MNTPEKIILHCSDVPSTSGNQLAQIDSYHKSEDFPKSSLGYYIGYHVLVTNGKKYKCREDWEVGAHCNTQVDGVSMNTKSLAICWAGDGDIELPNAVDTALIKEQILEWQAHYSIGVEPHRKYNKNKTCPGLFFTDEYIQALITPKPPEQCAKQEAIIKEKQSVIDTLIDWIRDKFS